MPVNQAYRKCGVRLIAVVGVIAVVISWILLFRTDVAVPQDYDHTVAFR